MKLCKDCQIPITTANAYLDRGTLRARCKKCDYRYRSSRAGTDAYAYMDKLFSKLKLFHCQRKQIRNAIVKSIYICNR